MSEPLTSEKAKESVGKRFYVKLPDDNDKFKKVLFNSIGYDTILSVHDGVVYGEIVVTDCSNCYLVNEQPEQLKKLL